MMLLYEFSNPTIIKLLTRRVIMSATRATGYTEERGSRLGVAVHGGVQVDELGLPPFLQIVEKEYNNKKPLDGHAVVTLSLKDINSPSCIGTLVKCFIHSFQLDLR